MDRDMDLKRMRTFVAVAERGGVSRAALLLRITQPALSRQIRDLQEELGFKLFERLGRHLSLTGEGEEFLRDCRSLLSHAGSVVERAQSLRRGNTGVLRVAASPQMIESVFPIFLRHYAKLCPGVHIKLIESAHAEQLAKLETGEVHMAINIMRPDDLRLASCSLTTYEVLAAWAPSIRIRQTSMIDIRVLARLPLLLPNSGFGSRKLFDGAFRLGRLETNVVLESVAPHTLLALAEAGHGVAIIPSNVRIDSKKLRVACVSYRGQLLRGTLAILWDKQRPLPRYAESFSEALIAHMQKIFPISGPSGARHVRTPRSIGEDARPRRVARKRRPSRL
jgi:DNA-binding transcriptional LysR family regulator